MANVKNVGGKGVRGVRADQTPWVQVYPNGGSALILIFGNAAVRSFGLKRGDRVSLDFDEETRQVRLRRIDVEAKLAKLDRRTTAYREMVDKLSAFPMLSPHGGVVDRLKLPITEFAREHFGNLALPYKTNVSRIGGGLMVFDLPAVRQRKPKPRAVRKPVVQVTPEPEPAAV